MMASLTECCPICRKSRLFTPDGLRHHVMAKHKKHHPRTFQLWPQDEDESIASRMLKAQIEAAMGGPVEEDYLLDMIP